MNQIIKCYVYIAIIVIITFSLCRSIYATSCAPFHYNTKGYDLVFVWKNISSTIVKTSARPDNHKWLFFEKYKTIANFQVDKIIKWPSLKTVILETNEYTLWLWGLWILEWKMYIKAQLEGDKYISNMCMIWLNKPIFSLNPLIIIIFFIPFLYLLLRKTKKH